MYEGWLYTRARGIMTRAKECPACCHFMAVATAKIDVLKLVVEYIMGTQFIESSLKPYL